MKKIFLAVLIVFYSSQFFAQSQDKLTQDPVAKQILDAVSLKTKAYQTIKASFTLLHEDKAQNNSDTKKGTIFLKGDKYKIFFIGTNTEISYDGKTMATFVISDNEVTYSNPEKKDETTLTPANLFTIYEKGFYYKMIEEMSENTRKFYVIDLIPMQHDKRKYSRIRIKVDKLKNELAAMKSFGKDGSNFTIEVTEMVPNIVMNDKMFTFNKEDHPGVEVIDNRD
jgi:outer membrane lipoprotein carrier protein